MSWDSWGRKKSDTTESLNWTELKTERPKKVRDCLGTHSLVASNQDKKPCPYKIWYHIKTSWLHKGSFSLFWQLRQTLRAVLITRVSFRRVYWCFACILHLWILISNDQAKTVWGPINENHYLIREILPQKSDSPGNEPDLGTEYKWDQPLVRGCIVLPHPFLKHGRRRTEGEDAALAFFSHLGPRDDQITYQT